MTQAAGASGAGDYDAIKLHSMNDRCWAVVSRRTGAIALDRDKLLMRLTEAEARRIAREMSGTARPAESPNEAG